jgi:hypothetical protein
MRGEAEVRECHTLENGPFSPRPGDGAGHAGGGVATADGAAVARWFAETWGGRAVGGDRTACPFDRGGQRLVRAAERARSRYPGAVGELVSREILAYRDFGQRFDGSGFIARLVTDVLSERPGDRRGQGPPALQSGADRARRARR